MRCIICKKVNLQMSEEHVIPDAIGGVYKIYSVCKECNNMLGQSVDMALISHKIMEFARFHNKIKSRKGYIPNPLGSKLLEVEGENFQVKTYINENGELDYKIITTGIEEIAEGKYSFVIDKNDEGNVEKILGRFINKLEIDRNDIEVVRHERKVKPVLKCNFLIDTNKFKLGLLKIAYEFAANNISEFVDDAWAKRIVEVICSGKLDIIESRRFLKGNGVSKDVTEIIDQIANRKDQYHYIVMVSRPQHGLYVYISLFNSMNIMVRLSDRYYKINKDDILILENDTIKHEASIYDVTRYVERKYVSTAFVLYKNANNIIEINDDINAPIPVYYKSGIKAYNDIRMIPMKKLKMLSSNAQKDIVCVKYRIKCDLYVYDKMNELIQVKYYEARQNRI